MGVRAVAMNCLRSCLGWRWLPGEVIGSSGRVICGVGLIPLFAVSSRRMLVIAMGRVPVSMALG